MHRTYENDDLVIFWDSDKCFHAKKCVTGSPGTFDPTRRPWIELGHDENSRIWQAISKCPSGALKCIYKHEIRVVFDGENSRSVAYHGDVEVGECNFDKSGNGWNIYHTGVLPEYEGRALQSGLYLQF